MVSEAIQYASMAEKASVLTTEQVLAEWDVIGNLLELGIPYSVGRTSIEDIKQNIIDGYSIVMIAWNPDPKAPEIHAAFLVDADVYPKKKVMNITLCGGGNIQLWAHLWPQLKASAKSQGFDQIEINGRAGWSKFISAKEVSRTFVEEL